MANRIVILGGGTGGTMIANRLRRLTSPEETFITVVDRDDRHVYQPGLLFVPFGLTEIDDIVRSRRAQLRDGILFRRSEVDRVDVEADEVHLENGKTIPYDVLVVATGSRLQPEETDGMAWPPRSTGMDRCRDGTTVQAASTADASPTSALRGEQPCGGGGRPWPAR